jgi:hypothetical protein
MSRNETADPQAILAEVFAFSQADIVANRRRELSAAQRARIARKHHADVRLVRGVFVTIFGVGLLGFSADRIRHEDMNVRSLLIYFGVMAFFACIVGASMLFNRYRLNRTLREGSVQPVEGKIQLITKRDGRLLMRYFCVGSQRFKIDNYAHFTLLEQSGVAGQEAIMYVTTPWRSVLSVVLKT